MHPFVSIPEAMLRTPRLVLRQWRDADLEPFAAMNADPEVMALMPAPLDRAGSDALVARFRRQFDQHGFGLWAVGAPGVADLLGFVGLSIPNFTAPFTPCVEVGWRLARRYWGRGYATEAARAAVAVGFTVVGLPEIVSFTTPTSLRSIAVMERLGMIRDPRDDFDHPALPEGHALRRHLLYRLTRERWLRQSLAPSTHHVSG